MNKDSNSIIILANGNFPSHQIPLNFLKNQSKIICCDGAIDKLKKIKIKADFIIGDLDSISNKSKKKYKDITLYNPDQNFNDLYKALEWCEKNNFSNISILGASGKREDHFLNNLFILFEFSTFAKLQMITDDGIFTLISKKTSFKSYSGQPVSIISIDKTIKIKTTNLNFPINNKTLLNIYSGTLNYSNSTNFNISLTKGSILVFQKHSNISSNEINTHS
tara:strand:- start:560 stop:1222 length:663 start_codon:yes stop_codon:yes gene_type:complete